MLNFLQQIGIDMLVHSDYVNRASEQMLKEAFQTHQKKSAWFHLDADIHITSLMLFISRNRATDTQRTYSKHAF